jgi:hypothetical protein
VGIDYVVDELPCPDGLCRIRRDWNGTGPVNFGRDAASGPDYLHALPQ